MGESIQPQYIDACTVCEYSVEIETACSHSELSQVSNVSGNLPGRIAPFSFDPEIYSHEVIVPQWKFLGQAIRILEDMWM